MLFSKQLEYYANEGDLLIAISSSGESKNILNGVDEAKKKNCNVITMSGFSSGNSLRKKGQINFDKCISTPEMMVKVSALGQIL